ncbi:MAG TPA: MoxR family ATPase [Acidimicrobiales bacterium]|nr:MoxR family ATPase [Acidimicrobiales bacterium]
MTPDDYAACCQAIEAEIAKVIVGQQELVRQVLVTVLCEGHALIEGVPGLGKTMLLKTLAAALDLQFARIQFTPDLMPADIVGTQVLEEDETGRRRFRYRAGPVFANLVLADEVNRATPKTQSALLEAMQERMVTVAGETRALPRPFFVMATQNPLEMEGTYPLPEAQLDRFLIKALVPFPPAADLVAVVERTTGAAGEKVRPVADAEALTAMIELTRQVPVASHLTAHAVDLVVATHPDQEPAPERVRRYVCYGASPRAAQALILAAKAQALLDGRPNVSAADIRAVAPAALRHRLMLGYEATADGVTADDVVAAVLDAVPEPSTGLRGAP